LALHDETHVPRKKPCRSSHKIWRIFFLIYESQEEESGRYEIMKKKKKTRNLFGLVVRKESDRVSDTLFLSLSLQLLPLKE